MISTSIIKTEENIPLERLIKLTGEGDKQAFASLYGATKASVYAYAMAMLRDHHAAEDIMQDCYLRIYLSAPGYTPQGKPMAWIMTVVRNLCADQLKRRSRIAPEPEEGWETYLVSEDDTHSEDRIFISQCLSTLSDDERKIVVLHAVSGLKHREIASLLGMPLATVLSKYNRSIKKLRNMM